MRIKISYEDNSTRGNIYDAEDVMRVIKRLSLPQKKVLVKVSCKVLKLEDEEFEYNGECDTPTIKIANDIFTYLQKKQKE